MNKPSIRKNTIANYAGQLYLTLIGIVVTPFYLQYLGAEAYGLVGFFALMQAWMNLLDLGLSPTLGRQAAYARGTENGFEFFKKLLKSFEVIFLGLAIIVFLSIFFTKDWLAVEWIKSESLKTSTLTYCIGLMGVMIGLRWLVGLYRSGINGLEDQVWLNIANIVVTSLKFLGALFLLKFITHDVRHFFEYQLFISLIEIGAFMYRFYSRLPATIYKPKIIDFDTSVVKSIAPFALGIAYTAGIWVLVTQTDKLVLSGILTLSEYGYFSLVALVAGSVTILSGPISQAILPRLTLLYSQNKKKELLEIYGNASQLAILITLSVASMVGFYSKPLLYAWTGNIEASEWGASILFWFALGNGVLGISAYQYYLQVAFGDLKLHVIGSTISAIIQVPLIYYAAKIYGAYGAGVAWFSFRTIWFFTWTPIVHKRFIPGFHLKWLLTQILPIAITVIITSYLITTLLPLDLNQNRFILFIQMIGLGILLLLLSLPSSKFIRKSFLSILTNR
ncbi:lipopolysaccharide biosynthesis protein [Psychrobacter faecalis]|uniref:lipopolysaccharide biosynthesis protein n=1 Tax=Psychrobacter faecalis TaxID=180588 RepID=UPI00191979A5|nr:polysaccharide biosynthesis protein [Psychrobacter faecalis]